MIKAVPADASPRLTAALDRLRQLHPIAIDLSMGRIERLLAKLGHPERALAPVIHVAGTNGKGSTVAFLRAMLEAAGWRVHVYTSPHLVRFNERIRLAGELIGDDPLADLLEDCERVNGDDPVTFFEVTTAAAFRAFADVPADMVLLEVGLGGRLDATNVIARPAVSVLTRISFDHMQFLGSTLAEIAWEKAGILKPGSPAVAGPQMDPSVLRVFADRAAELGVDLTGFGDPGAGGWQVAPSGPDGAEGVHGGFRYESPRGTLDALPSPALPGAHQLINAGLAIAALERQHLAVPEAAIRRGLATVSWPARLQRLTRGPLPALLPPGWDLWLDGGHNDSAGEVLAVQAAAWNTADSARADSARADSADRGGRPRPLDLIFGMLGNKQPLAFLGPLAPHVRRLEAVAIPGEDKCLSPDEGARLARAAGIPAAQGADSVAAALARLVAAPGAVPGRILVCGSLYLAGTVLRENG